LHRVLVARPQRVLDQARCLRPTPTAAQLVQAAVIDDPVQPGRLDPLVLELRRQPPKSLQICLLEHIVDAVRVSEHPERHPPQPRSVTIEQILEPTPRRQRFRVPSRRRLPLTPELPG
jgi:hypothetical protein